MCGGGCVVVQVDPCAHGGLQGAPPQAENPGPDDQAAPDQSGCEFRTPTRAHARRDSSSYGIEGVGRGSGPSLKGLRNSLLERGKDPL